MPLNLEDFRQGVEDYWREIGRRSIEVQKREHAFTELPVQFASRNPPRFTRDDLKLIMRWKHTDARWRDRALNGLDEVTDERLTSLTSPISGYELDQLLAHFRGAIHGVGIASISAMLTAARPDRFCVIDEFALKAIHFHYRPQWLRKGKDGKFIQHEKTYAAYVKFCREKATYLTASSDQPWTPRLVEMALWAIGKKLTDSHTCN